MEGLLALVALEGMEATGTQQVLAPTLMVEAVVLAAHRVTPESMVALTVVVGGRGRLGLVLARAVLAAAQEAPARLVVAGAEAIKAPTAGPAVLRSSGMQRMAPEVAGVGADLVLEGLRMGGCMVAALVVLLMVLLLEVMA